MRPRRRSRPFLRASLPWQLGNDAEISCDAIDTGNIHCQPPEKRYAVTAAVTSSVFPPGRGSAMRFLSECGQFIRESRRHFHEIGSVLPSSRFLARALVSEMKKTQGPCRVLEVGSGTGPVTAQVVR